MQIITNPEQQLHNPPYEILDGELKPYFEEPRRAAIILAALAEAGFAAPVAPRPFGLAPILAVHSPDYVEYLEQAHQRWVAAGKPAAAVLPSSFPLRGLGERSTSPVALAGRYCFDLSAPITAGTYAAARGSAAAALTGAALLLEGARAAYALCRPPGHHAAQAMAGGYCYLNNAAIAAHYLATDGRLQDDNASTGAAGPRDHGPARDRGDLPIAGPAAPLGGAARPPAPDPGPVDGAWAMRPPAVAVLDIDIHHGNGTQAIFYERSDVFFVSIHADPNDEYPYFLGHADERGAGAGEGYNLNIPLEAGTDDARYLAALDTALDTIAAYGPRYLVVSAGLDTFGGDPLGDFALTTPGYAQIGARLARLGMPTLFVQEGGYAVDDLGRNVVSLLRGFLGAAH